MERILWRISVRRKQWSRTSHTLQNRTTYLWRGKGSLYYSTDESNKSGRTGDGGGAKFSEKAIADAVRRIQERQQEGRVKGEEGGGRMTQKQLLDSLSAKVEFKKEFPQNLNSSGPLPKQRGPVTPPEEKEKEKAAHATEKITAKQLHELVSLHASQPHIYTQQKLADHFNLHHSQVETLLKYLALHPHSQKIATNKTTPTTPE